MIHDGYCDLEVWLVLTFVGYAAYILYWNVYLSLGDDTANNLANGDVEWIDWVGPGTTKSKSLPTHESQSNMPHSLSISQIP
jgi:hypothetical protein